MQNRPILSIDLDYLPGLSYLLYHAHVPSIRKIILENPSATALDQLSLELSPSNDFAQSINIDLGYMAGGQVMELENIQPTINGKFFASLTESMREHWKIKIFRMDELLLEKVFDVNLLAFDQWLGQSLIPELLSGFILPNIPELVPIVHKSAELLKAWTGSPTFDEYQSKNPNRVKNQIGAIYEGIKSLNIIYQSTPASFGDLGQRVRLPDQVLSDKTGNCLDMSILFASFLEHIGLHPILILIEGHAFVGAWLIEDTFPDSVNDDPTLLTKRMADGIHELFVMEATCLNSGNSASLDQAIEVAKGHFQDLKKFQYFIDVKRSRFSGIYPLPQRRFEARDIILTEDPAFFSFIVGPSAPKKLEYPSNLTQPDGTKQNFPKQQLWERKLLDLSLRNNLLNLRLSRSSIQFIEVPIGDLEDALFKGEEFQILSKPKDWENTLRDEGIYQAFSASNPLMDLVQKEFSQKRLRVYLNEEELNARLTFLYRSARLSLEENGANTLYLAIGVLRWYETEKSEKARFAPILLLPVELVRKSVKTGYTIRGRDEDAVLNITLIEKLRQDFDLAIPGLDPLPEDESGVDVKLVFTTIRQAIKNLSRWDLEEQFFLGTFSFNKFILWNDIHSNTEQLKQSPIVQGLLEGTLKKSIEVFERENLDEHYKPADILLPIPADSSQLEAVCASVEGHSFILHGPPGTGKSQTITNIISNALYRGKRVLFVAEKMAALSVVYDRLKSIGLDPFCLELHSNKARKPEVLRQLKTATEVVKSKTGIDFKEESERINTLKAELDILYQKLHQETFHGISLFEIFSRFVEFEKFPSDFTIPDQLIPKLNKENLRQFEDFLNKLSKTAEIAENPSKTHPLYGITLAQYSIEVREEIQRHLDSFIQERTEYLLTLKSYLELLSLEKEIGGEERSKLEGLAGSLSKVSSIPEKLFHHPNPQSLTNEVIPLVQRAAGNLELEIKLKKSFESQILVMDAERLLREWKIKDQEWFLPRFFGLRKLRIYLQSYLKDKQTLTPTEIKQTLNEVIDYQESKKLIENKKYELQQAGIFEHLGNPERLLEIKKQIPDFLLIHSSLYSFFSTNQEVENAKRKLWELISYSNPHWQSRSEKLIALSIKDQQASRLLESKTGTKITFQLKLGQEDGLERVKGWREHIENLKEWHAWNLVKSESKSFYLEEEILKQEEKGIQPSMLKGTILKETYRKMANEYLKEHPDLSVFSGDMFETKIAEFKELNSQFSKLTKEILLLKLSERIPDFSKEGATNSETSILQKTIKNNGRGMPLRKLFKSIPNLLPKVSPCMLMSPISVAQYLEIHQEPFDLLIFDEASQMPTSEAVGAMSRAKQLIIVGDPKQMPPTNFFSSVHIDEEDLNEDLESILDDCEALSVPSKQLKWHYRSKHESLIAFSNAKYYENSLFTFPSPDDLDSRVKFIKMNGVYDRGKTKQNSAEAEAIVSELVKRLQVPIEERRSVGVVTFSSVQQTLIEDLLMERFRKNPKLEEQANSFTEPYFIKNLENVQGDERDIILFSICYGPDQNGNIALNFGPLNRDGGWRRLNVAVSRARYEMIIYSSITSDQLDLNRTKSEGVAGLKAFLSFAEKGKILLPPSKNEIQKNQADGLAKSIGEFLIEQGYQVKIGLGSSGFKIDLAVIHPQNPEKYVLGIILDTKAHSSSKSSIDRLLVQESVLELLGWNIIKVWSLDWWESQGKVKKKLIAKIEEIKTKPELKSKTSVSPLLAKAEEPQKIKRLQKEEIEEKEVSTSKTNYQKVSLPQIYNTDPLVAFMSDTNTPKQHEHLVKIVNTEGPILQNLLVKRLIEVWGISLRSNAVQKKINQLLETDELDSTKEPNGERCFWPKGMDSENYSQYRELDQENQKRDIEEIPVKELTNGIIHILKQQISLPFPDLVREGTKEFGFAKTGNQVKEKLEFTIKLMLNTGQAAEREGRIRLGK